jgi:dynein heavy chain
MQYFILIQLHNIEHMYQFSLDAYLVFFIKAMKKTEAKEAQAERVEALRDTLRVVICTWVMRGLFERHKLIFLTQLVFSLMQREVVGQESGFGPKYLNFLLRGPIKPGEENPIEWLPQSAWDAVQALIEIEGFERFASDFEENAPRFLEWYNHATPESEKLPLDWRELERTPFLKLLVVRCLRPDRMTTAIENFIVEMMPGGTRFTECDGELNSFQVLELSYADSGPTVPLYFILSAGANVGADIDRLAQKMDMVDGTNYHNVSLGQGQDVVAMDRLATGREQGHWVVLHNVHLMPKWLNELNKLIDKMETGDGGRPNDDFRIMLSSDPANSIPFGLLERSIKLTNEPPSGLKANIKRAFCNFARDEYEDMEPRTKGILFGLCHFHSLMLERKKFGAKGFNMMYPFAVGDLLCSVVVLRNYMENAPAQVPWTDLQYLFGEIMYGGHIVNGFDRLVCGAYLDFFMKDDLLDEKAMFPYSDDRKLTFQAPKTSSSYDRVLEHIDTELKTDTPLAYGLHPNAEIGFRTDQAVALFKTVMSLQPRAATGAAAAGDGGSADGPLQDILDQMRDAHFECVEIAEGMEEIGPFQNVFLQECDRMNVLQAEMMRSLLELEMGFRGELTMSDAMEQLGDSLFSGVVPSTWVRYAYPSMRPLTSWLADLAMRFQQLSDWTSNPLEIPVTTWLSGIFNPQSFLTAIMQVRDLAPPRRPRSLPRSRAAPAPRHPRAAPLTFFSPYNHPAPLLPAQVCAQTDSLELDKLTILTEPTKRTAEAIDTHAREGCYVHGFALEGAHWDTPSGNLESSLPREMFCDMPVIQCKAVVIEDGGHANTYMCPVYKTRDRGPTYVFTATLRTKAPSPKWVLAGACMILDTN